MKKTCKFVKKLIKKANDGDREAQYYYGRLLEGTFLIESPLAKISYKKAFYFFKRSANLFFLPAQRKVAEYYDLGKGVKKDWQAAALWRNRCENCKLTNEEIHDLVTFRRDEFDNLYIENIHDDVWGSVYGTIHGNIFQNNLVYEL